MRFIPRTLRIIKINLVLLKHDLDKLVWSMPVFRPLYFLIIFFPWRWFKSEHQLAAKNIRLALEELGPIFVKFGQLLSTRRDLLPDEIANELAKLQDAVPPFSGDIAKKMIESSLKTSLEKIFAEFNPIPLASASIAQVHAASLKDGTEVVIKVLRPNIEQAISQDIEVLEYLAKLVHKYIKRARRLRPLDLVAEFKRTLIDELDLLREAANASQLKRNFANTDILHIPEVYWDHCRNNMLVSERIRGVPIADQKQLVAKEVDLKLLAERGVEIFFLQAFRDCFFHADMHPGNLFINIDDPNDPKYNAVDFGIVGTLGPEDQRYLAENFLAFFNRDYKRVAKLHVQSGWVPPTTRLDTLESAIRTLCEPIFEKPLKDISFGQTLLRLFQVAREFEMEVQPQLLLLQKTLVSIEGLGRQLYPELDLWHTAKPYFEQWVRSQVSIKKTLQEVKVNLPSIVAKLPELPNMLLDTLSYHQEKSHYYRYQRTYPQQKVVDDLGKTIKRAILGATLVIVGAGALIYSQFQPEQNIIINWVDVVVIGIGLYLLIR